jgi:hypothetical protein
VIDHTIVVTLAVGPKYVELGAALLHALDRAGNATLVVTDDPAPFPERTIKIPYTPDGAHIWHAKRHAIRAGLERAQTVYFVDADYRMYTGWTETIPILQPLPIGATALWPIKPLGEITGGFIDMKLLDCPRLLEALQTELWTPDWQRISWWGDYLYAVARDETRAWQAFIEAWDRFVHYLPEGVGADASYIKFVAGDGIAMAFAAAAVGWRPVARYDAFIPIRRAFRHVCVGTDYKLALEQAKPSSM